VTEAIGLATREGRRGLGRQHPGAIDYAEGLPTEGAEAFIDDTNYPIFGAGEKAAG
jgi:hypothetical protein